MGSFLSHNRACRFERVFLLQILFYICIGWTWAIESQLKPNNCSSTVVHSLFCLSITIFFVIFSLIVVALASLLTFARLQRNSAVMHSRQMDHQCCNDSYLVTFGPIPISSCILCEALSIILSMD